MDAAAMRAALAAAQNDPAAPARPGRAPGGTGARGSNGDADVLTALLRDHLFLRQEMRPVADAVQIAVLFRSKAETDAFYALVQKWVANLPDGGGKKRKAEGEEGMTVDGGKGAPPVSKGSVGPRRKGGTPHPWGHKKTFMLHAFFSRMHEIVSGLDPDKTAGLTPQAKEAGLGHLTRFTQLGSRELDRFFSGFTSKYPKPMDDRTWLWVLTVNLVMIPEDLRLSLGHVMEMAEYDGVDIKVELKHSNQGKPEEQLWTTLRERRR